jgi:hypothetical protein
MEPPQFGGLHALQMANCESLTKEAFDVIFLTSNA